MQINISSIERDCLELKRGVQRERERERMGERERERDRWRELKGEGEKGNALEEG